MGKATTTATVTIPDVVGIDQYTVVATAFDLAGNESDKSHDATKDVVVYFWKDITAPLAPQLLKVLQLIAGSLERIALALEKSAVNN
jgi:hypothetical protein